MGGTPPPPILELGGSAAGCVGGGRWRCAIGGVPHEILREAFWEVCFEQVVCRSVAVAGFVGTLLAQPQVFDSKKETMRSSIF